MLGSPIAGGLALAQTLDNPAPTSSSGHVDASSVIWLLFQASLCPDCPLPSLLHPESIWLQALFRGTLRRYIALGILIPGYLFWKLAKWTE